MTAVVERPSAPSAKTGHATVASKVRDWALRRPQGVAMREKDLGIWREITWASVWDRCPRRRPRSAGTWRPPR